MNDLLSTPQRQLTFVLLFAVLVIFSQVSFERGLANYDDCFYAQKAKEMLQTGDWFTMHYAGQPAFENPPGFMWFIGLSYLVWGVSEYGAVFPSALMGVATVLLVYLLAARLFDRWVAFFSSLALSSTFIFTKYARHAMMDVTLACVVTLAMVTLAYAADRNRRLFLAWGLCVALAILIKSALGLFPLIIAVLFLAATGRWRMLLDPHFIGGVLISLALGFSWHVHQYLSYGSAFLGYHFGWVILERGYGLQPQPWYEHLSYGRDLLRYYWPWLAVFVPGLYFFGRMAWHRERGAILCFLWVAVYLVVMSSTQSRMLWYIMPVFPAASIVCGWTLNHVLTDRTRQVASGVALSIGVVAFIALTALPVRLSSEREGDVREIAPYVRHASLQNARVVGYGFDFYSVNNALLFYSDRSAQPVYETLQGLTAAMQDTAFTLCVVPPGGEATLRAQMIVKRTATLLLVSNRPYDVSGVVCR